MFNSANKDCFSTALIFFWSPSRYCSCALFERRSRTDSRHSCTPSLNSSCAERFLRMARFCKPEEVATTRNAIGITQKLDRASRQSKAANKLIPTMATDNTEPISSGIQWLDAVSICAQSDIILVVRSLKSFFPK